MGKNKKLARLLLLMGLCCAMVGLPGSCQKQAGKTSEVSASKTETSESSVSGTHLSADAKASAVPEEASDEESPPQDAPSSSEAEPESDGTVSENAPESSDALTGSDPDTLEIGNGENAAGENSGIPEKDVPGAGQGAEKTPPSSTAVETLSPSAESTAPSSSEEGAASSSSLDSSEEPTDKTSESETASDAESNVQSSAESSVQSSTETTDFTLWSPDTGYVSAGSDAGDGYFSDALFIGNSRMQGFALYCGLPEVHAYTDVGLMVDTAYTKKCISVDGEKIPLTDAITRTGAGYQKFYLMFGLNELGWSSYKTFVSKYGGIVDTILAANSDAKVYLQSIIPLTAEKSAESSWLNNENVNVFNKLIWQLAADKGVYYLDVASGLAGSDGTLPAEGSSDGVHLNKTWCGKWLAYLKNHTA